MHLDLSNNQLTGNIPTELGSLSSLQSLTLGVNGLTGGIPTELGGLSNVLDLWLEWNELTGSIPTELGGLSSVRRLFLYSNDLSGSIPSELGSLGNMQDVRLARNQLSGGIPTELGSLSKLATLTLDMNRLSGRIPTELGGLSDLTSLRLCQNQLSGNIPSELGNLTNLQRLVLNSNQLSGSIPSELGNLSSLLIGWLDLRWNALHTNDAALRAFLNDKQGGNWENTQTVAPASLAVSGATTSSVGLSWTPIAYTSDTGGYRVRYSAASGGPYALFGATATKLDSSMIVTSLDPGAMYYFVVDTVTYPHDNNENTVVSEATTEIAVATPALPTLSIGDSAVSEGDSGTATSVLTVSLSETSDAPITVEYATADGTAEAPADYTATSGTLSFAPGSTTRTFAVSVVGDVTDEPDERYYVHLGSPVNAFAGDSAGMGAILDDDGADISLQELTHGSSLWTDLSVQPGPVADEDLYALVERPYSSYEVVVDGASGDVGAGSGPTLDLVAPHLAAVLSSSAAYGSGPGRSLRLENATALVRETGYVRVRSGACTTDCGPDDAYRIRAYETTGTIPRFNNSGTQITVLTLQNPTERAISGHVNIWDSAGALLAAQPFNLSGRTTLVLNTATIPGATGKSGTLTITHDGRYGDLAGKAVALESSTGFSFDTPLVPRAR